MGVRYRMSCMLCDDEMADTYRRHWVRANDEYIKALDDEIMSNRMHAPPSTSSSQYNRMHA